MLTWLSANLGTIVIGLILLIIVVAISVHLVNNLRQGKSSCGAGCSHCAMGCGSCGGCHQPKQQ